MLAKSRFRLDDSLDVVGIHGVGGLTGTILLGVFASKAVNPGGADGLLAGNAGFLGTQLLAVGVVGVFAFVASYVLLKVVNAVSPLRLAGEEESMGLDISQHSETAYGD